MNKDHRCSAACGAICHMNATAQAMYLDMIYADRFAEAEELRTSGVPS
jgi:hypothetical protein